MAIERLKRTWFLVPRGELPRLIQALAEAQTVHVVDLREEPRDEALPHDVPSSGDVAAARAAAEGRAQKLSRVLAVLDGFAPPKRRLHENFVSLPAEMHRDEFDRAVAEIDADALYDRVGRLARAHASAAKRAEGLHARIAQLEPWASASAPPAGLARCAADLGTLPAQNLPRLVEAARGLDAVALQVVQTSKAEALVAVAWLREAADKTAELLDRHGFHSLELAPGAGRIADVLETLRRDLAEAEAEAESLREQAVELARKRRAVLAARAHWQAEVERCRAHEKAVASKRIVVLSGYVRAREMKPLEALLAREFPSVGLVARDPQPDEHVPVSLGGSKLFAPAQFLTSMFGLPDYFGFDPSPYIFFTFLLFFGFCFGDVVYGLMLLVVGRWLAWKSRDYPSLARFFGLLAWCGIASVIVGALTGSWAADLVTGGYLGAAPAETVKRLMLLDPLKKTVTVLGIVLVIGMMNQFYGMLMLMYREWRKRHYVAALCDGGLWLVFLPGLVLLLVSAAADLPSAWGNIALGMIAFGGVGLVLTQGRREPTFLGKAITGVVSLYGILGTYGTTTFIGDTLSYSRLLALGLTTVIVGTSVNTIAVILPDVIARFLSAVLPFLSPVADFIMLPVVAGLIAAAVCVVGHVLNFFISVLGGFVHSARLIFVEFFTKFYEGGAPPFVPLGEPQSVRVIENE